MFKLNIDPRQKKAIISPEDLLPKRVENTRGELVPFDANKIIESLIEETEIPMEEAKKVTTNVLRKISSLGLELIAAPHVRELVCGEMTSMKLHKYRNRYTRLGIPIYDIKKMIESQTKKDDNGEGNACVDPIFSYLWIVSQVVEQYVHLDKLSDEAMLLIDKITADANKLEEKEKQSILQSLENSIKLLNEKKEGKI